MATKKAVLRRKPEGAYHHGDLKTSLKRAALRLVREKGPRGFSLNEASRLAGVTVAAPYRHFADKDALLAELACDGNELLAKELRAASNSTTGVKEQMLAAGMAYLRFSRTHSDYFRVIFYAGIEKRKYPELEHSAREAFGIICQLARQFEATPELAEQRAVSAWALVHGLATLIADGALSTAMEEKTNFDHVRPILSRFLHQPYR